ncbi:MAG: hypothetical protein AAF197_03995 [Pseudomonadota bacterium]
MSRSRSAWLAYLLLALMVFLLVRVGLFMVSPQLQSVRSETLRLEHEVQSLSKEKKRSSGATASFIDALNRQLRSNRIGEPSNSDMAMINLQSFIKAELGSLAASIRQLRPVDNANNLGLWRSELELSFDLPAKHVDQFLIKLAEHPSINIRSLNLQRYVDLEGKVLVDANFQLAEIGFSKELGAVVSELTEPHDTPPPITSNAWTVELDGLFDSMYRTRALAPPSQHYRLAGISVSNADSIALLVDLANGEVERKTVGQSINGWLVESISAGEVVLTQKGERDAILLPSNN